MPPRIQSIDHVGLHVADVSISVAFYRDVLGLTAIDRPDLGFPGAWFRIGSSQELHLIGKNSNPDNPPRERHFAIAVEDATAWQQHLQRHGLELDGPRPRPDGAVQIFVRDPDGHVIELLHRG